MKAVLKYKKKFQSFKSRFRKSLLFMSSAAQVYVVRSSCWFETSLVLLTTVASAGAKTFELPPNPHAQRTKSQFIIYFPVFFVCFFLAVKKTPSFFKIWNHIFFLNLPSAVLLLIYAHGTHFAEQLLIELFSFFTHTHIHIHKHVKGNP